MASSLGYELTESELGSGAAVLFGLPSASDLGRTLSQEAGVPWVVVHPLVESFDSIANWSDLLDGLQSFLESKLSTTKTIWIVDETVVSEDQRQDLRLLYKEREGLHDAWYESSAMTREFIRRTLDGEDIEFTCIVLLAPRRNADLLNFIENESVSLVLVNGSDYAEYDKRIVASFSVNIPGTLKEGTRIRFGSVVTQDLHPIISFTEHASSEN